MHKEQARLFGEQVAMHRGHFDLIFPQRLDDRIYLGVRENEIAGDCGLAATRRWKLIEVATPIGPGKQASFRLHECARDGAKQTDTSANSLSSFTLLGLIESLGVERRRERARCACFSGVS